MAKARRRQQLLLLAWMLYLAVSWTAQWAMAQAVPPDTLRVSASEAAMEENVPRRPSFSSAIAHSVYLPVVLHNPCSTHTTSLSLESSGKTINVGELLTVTATLANSGCANVGLPRYTLMIDYGDAEPIFDPAQPEPVVHYVGLGPGDSDQVAFTLRAIGPGEARLRASVSFEVHLGYPGPAYWSACGAGPLTVEVFP